MDVINQESGKNWTAYHGDSCEVLKGFPDSSIGYSIFSHHSAHFTHILTLKETLEIANQTMIFITTLNS
jgi:hypothetical protein